jgi:hypothetical protein
MKNPEAYSLERVNWDLFCHLTLPGNLLLAGDTRLGSTIFAWLRCVADFGGIHFRDLLWVTRSEVGEATGRLHFHALLGGLPAPARSRRSRFAVKNQWEKITRSMSRVYRFNDGLPGVGYVLKGGAAYEAGKFSRSADVVCVSQSIVRAFELGGAATRVLR